MKKIKLYGPFLLGLILLLIISFFLPQMIFRIQDGSRLVGKSVESWEYMDNELVSAGYEKDMYQRMANLATKSADELTVSAISYGGKNVDEVVELLERAFASEWMGYINELSFGLYYDFLQETSTVNIQDCAKYVIYENSSLEEILLMVWYLDIYMVDYDTNVRLLVDAEMESVYYITITGGSGQEKIYKDYTTKGKSGTKEFMETITSEIMGSAPYFVWYFNEYYEGGMEELEGFAEYDAASTDAWYVTKEETETGNSVSFYMPYGNVGTVFEVRMEEGMGILPDFSAGLALIRDYVPEMIQK